MIEYLIIAGMFYLWVYCMFKSGEDETTNRRDEDE